MSTFMAVFDLFHLARYAGHAWAGNPPKEMLQYLKQNAPFRGLSIGTKAPSLETQTTIRSWFPDLPDLPRYPWEEADAPTSEVDCWARYALALLMSEGALARTKVGPTWRFTPWSRPFTWDIDPETAVTAITVKDDAGPVLRATMDGCVVTVDVLRSYTSEQLETLRGLVNATGRAIPEGLWAMSLNGRHGRAPSDLPLKVSCQMAVHNRT